MSNVRKKRVLRIKRKKRIRKKISGTAERPRMSVFRSARHVYVQVIDDTTGRTLASVSSFQKGKAVNANVEVCGELGKKVGELCLSQNINTVVFDKNGYAYHGRVKAIAEAAREAGLNF
jgi:large subunit ribosomal protein L18